MDSVILKLTDKKKWQRGELDCSGAFQGDWKVNHIVESAESGVCHVRQDLGTAFLAPHLF